MTDKVWLTITFPPTFGHVDLVRAALQGICRERFTRLDAAEATDDFCLAATEAMNNAVEHATAPEVVVELLLDVGEAGLRISTEGPPFDPTGPAAMPAFDADGDLPEGGFGLALIQELADRIDYVYRDRRNVLTIYKLFHCKPKEETDGD